MDIEKQPPPPVPAKKPYSSPQLHVYGSLPQIVGSVMGMTGNDHAWSAWHNTM